MHRQDDSIHAIHENRKTRLPRMFYLLIVLLLFVLWFGASFILPGVFPGYGQWGDLEFDANRWQSIDVKVPGNPRGAMVGDLLGSHDLIGLTRSQVRSLLGPPDHAIAAKKRQSVPAADAIEWHYYLGAYSGFQIDEDILVIEFGVDDLVVHWKVRQT